MPQELTWYYDERTRRYHDSVTKRFMRFSTVEGLIEKSLGALHKEARGLTNLMRAGQVPLDDWEAGMQDIVRRSYEANLMLARGGFDQVSDDDLRLADELLAFQYERLARFKGQIADEDWTTLGGKLDHRVQMYVNSGRQIFWRIETEAQREIGAAWERWILINGKGDEATCKDCHDLAAQGWVPIGTLPQPCDGSTQCLSSCRCSKRFSSAKRKPSVRATIDFLKALLGVSLARQFKRSYEGHCGLPGVHGGSRPKEECGLTGTAEEDTKEDTKQWVKFKPNPNSPLPAWRQKINWFHDQRGDVWRVPDEWPQHEGEVVEGVDATYFNRCWRGAMDGHKKHGYEIMIGYQIGDESLEWLMEEDRELHHWDMGNVFMFHVWNRTPDGSIYDSALGSTIASRSIYVGVPIPNEVISKFKKADDLNDYMFDEFVIPKPKPTMDDAERKRRFDHWLPIHREYLDKKNLPELIPPPQYKRSYEGHCGLPDVHGGSRPREECDALSGTTSDGQTGSYTSDPAFHKAATSQDVDDHSRLGGGITESKIIHYRDDGKAVWKHVIDPRTLGHNGEAEVAAYRISELLGFQVVPETVFADLLDEPGTSQRFIEGATEGIQFSSLLVRDHGSMYEPDFHFDTAVSAEERLRWERILVLDGITNHRDRHAGNWLVDSDGQLWAIDHGHIWWTRRSDSRETDRGVFYGNSLAPYRLREPVTGVYNVSQDTLDKLKAVKRKDWDALFTGMHTAQNPGDWDEAERRPKNLVDPEAAWRRLQRIVSTGKLHNDE